MSKIYVPQYDYSTNCAVIYDSNTIRVYNIPPIQNSDTSYIDYLFNSHYINKSGVEHFAVDSTLPSCIVDDDITTNVYYRNDLSDILVSFFILLIVCIYFPYRLISRMFGRWLKL